ncbi:MAG TPA: dihydroorotate dehydrogenase [Treponemataceae bacterium]|nr:dihydroorotate dehydrogenase [Treponemataceae bacterium]
MSKHDYSTYTIAKTLLCNQIKDDIFHLVVEVHSSKVPESGQFYLLKAQKSGVLLSRPISVYHIKNTSKRDKVQVEFLILKKGEGTTELCLLKKDDVLEVLGPIGNAFSMPNTSRIAIIGGGIGVAPVAGFASTLKPKSYDFYACFKTASYGLDYVNAKNLFVTTDDGSEGAKGMLPAVFNEQCIKEYGYTEIYACGPEPMLAYVHTVCGQLGVQCYLSLERRMACGVGACLGCSIATKTGNKRCCKEGPIFDGSILEFPLDAPKKNARAIELAKQNLLKECDKVSPKYCQKDADPDLSTSIGGVRLENPIIAASGTFGYGAEYADVFDVNKLGGICSKGLTLEPRSGNAGVRLHETPSGLINSIGLENPGIEHFIKHELVDMQSLKPAIIINLSGSSVDSYVRGAELLDTAIQKIAAQQNMHLLPAAIIELNISCPNVKAGGMAFGLDSKAASEVTSAVKKATSLPLMVKLSPNAPDIVQIAHAVREAGANAISLVNTFQAMAIDIEKGTPVFDNIKAGLAGPAIRPLALRMVYDVCVSMQKLPKHERIPVIGLGGIRTWQDAVEFIMAGATAVQVGTATFAQPNCMIAIIEGLSAYMKGKGFKTLSDFRACALV